LYLVEKMTPFKIILAGGGSGGPVAPLLAVYSEIKKTHSDARFLLVGTKNGPERRMAEAAGISFSSIVCGKWRRYFSPHNLLAPFLTLAGLISAILLLKKFRPSVVFGAGSFVQVPIIWAAWILGIPAVIHQQDIYPSLANKLTAWASDKINHHNKPIHKRTPQPTPPGIKLNQQQPTNRTHHQPNLQT
jgi:UDP-N-acetylglucosamine--N-acetylmuramyl-(pentapeptide) pyrophosphoryl-undecaprenol N-acetylglucosamine transferase